MIQEESLSYMKRARVSAEGRGDIRQKTEERERLRQ